MNKKKILKPIDLVLTYRGTPEQLFLGGDCHYDICEMWPEETMPALGKHSGDHLLLDHFPQSPSVIGGGGGGGGAALQ